MAPRAGYWAYALATGTAVLMELAVASTFGISGRWDVALMIAMLAGASYLVTPAHLRGQAARVFGTAGLALACFMAASAAGVMVGMSVAMPVMLDGAQARADGDIMVMAIAIVVAAAIYLALFRLGFALTAPREDAAA